MTVLESPVIWRLDHDKLCLLTLALHSLSHNGDAGDEGLRSVLVVGATAVIQHVRRGGRASPWALSSMDAPCIASCDNEAERTLGLQSSIRPCGAVGDRWPWWNPRIDAAITLSSLLLGQCLGFGRSRLPCFAITSLSPSQSRWQRLPAQPAA